MDSIITKFYAYLLTEKRVAQNTFAAYKRDIEQFVAYQSQKNKALTAIIPADIKEYLRYLKETLGMSARSMSRKISALKVLFAYIHEKYGHPNCMADILFPKLEKKLPSYLSEQEVQQLLMHAEQDSSELAVRNKVILYLLYTSGMRITELTQLKLSNIHFDTACIEIQGKGGKARMVPLPIQMCDLLKEYINTVHASFIEQKKQTTDYLFPIHYAGKIKPITRQAVWIMLKHLCQKSGIERSIHPHQLRHSLATHMLKNGVDLRSLQTLLGHENLATVQVYTHVETSYLRKIYDKKHPRS